MSTDRWNRAAPPAARYGRGAMAFHWTMFTLVVIVASWAAARYLAKQTQAFWIGVHALIGCCCGCTHRAAWLALRHAPRYCRTASDGLRAGCPVRPLAAVHAVVHHSYPGLRHLRLSRPYFRFRIVPGKPGIAKNRAIFEPTETFMAIWPTRCSGWPPACFGCLVASVLSARWRVAAHVARAPND